MTHVSQKFIPVAWVEKKNFLVSEKRMDNKATEIVLKDKIMNERREEWKDDDTRQPRRTRRSLLRETSFSVSSESELFDLKAGVAGEVHDGEQRYWSRGSL